jgi:hypothetical protein
LAALGVSREGGLLTMKRWLAILVAVMSSLVLVAAVLGSGMGQGGVPGAADAPTELLPAQHQFEVVNQFWGQIGDIEQAGNFMFMAVGGRVTIWDVSNPTQPMQVSQTPVFDSSPVSQMTIAGDYLYLAAGSKLRILDISVPTEPAEVGTYAASGWINGLGIFENHAYLTTGWTDISIVDITNPAEPQEAGIFTINSNWELWNLQITENFAVVTGFDDSDTPYWTGRVAGLNLSDPISPTVETIHEFASPPGIMIHNGYAYWYHDDARHQFVPRFFTLEIGTWEWVDYSLPDGGWPAAGMGDQLYMFGGWCENLCVLDVTDPMAITVVGDYPWPASRLVPIGGFLYALDDAGLHILESAEMGEVAFLPINLQSVRNVDRAGDYLMIEECLFRVIQPALPQRTACFEEITGLVTDIEIRGKDAYVTVSYYGSGDLFVIDLTKPNSPAIVATFNLTGTGQDVDIAGDYAFVASTDPFDGLIILNISEPTMPAVVSSYQTSGDMTDVTLEGNYAYVTSSFSGLHILDVTNPETPVEIGHLALFGAWSFVKRGDYLYVGGFYDGMYVVNVANPETPFEVAFFPTTYYSVRGIALSGQHALLRGGSYWSTVVVVDISEPASPTYAGSLDTPGTVEDMVLTGHYLYVADGANGLYILWQTTPAVTNITSAGGNLNSTDDQTWYVFPAGTFSETVTVTHTARYEGNLPGTGALVGIEHYFEVTGVYSGAGGTAEPQQPYALTIHYTEAERGVAIEETLGLYYWDGSDWVREESGVVDMVNNLIIAAPNRFGIWAVLGETERTFMPLGARD